MRYWRTRFVGAALAAAAPLAIAADASAQFPAVLDLSSLDGSDGFVINGIDQGDGSGRASAGAGDVNGDGVDDLIIGASGAAGSAGGSSGESYVVYGRDTSGGGAVFAASLELSALDGANGFLLLGDNSVGSHINDRTGRSVSGAGDVNGDGIDDLIIGADGADYDGAFDSGLTYVVFGRDPSGGGASFPASFDMGTLDGSNGFVLGGVDPGDNSGVSVSGAGDVNGDGVDDLIVGAYRADAPLGLSGASYVVFGRDTSGGGASFPAALDLSTLDGTDGFALLGADEDDRSGVSVSGAGDVNGDGVDDVIVGGYHLDFGGNPDPGDSYVVFGRDTSGGAGFPAAIGLGALNGTDGFALRGVAIGDRTGTSVSGAGDVNGDGVDDVIVGAYLADSGGQSYAGESYVVFGRDTSGGGAGFSASLDLGGLDGTDGFVLGGVDASDYSGVSVSAAGDVNGDGVDDLIIGAERGDPNGANAGESYVVYGRDTSTGGPGFPAAFDLGSLDGTDGFVIRGVNLSDMSGASVSGAGDVNGDGIEDLIIGASGADPGGYSYAGANYVIFGRRLAAGDFDGDGDVDLDDFGVFINSFQNSPQGGPPFAPGDFDEDGDVDLDDFGVFVADFQASQNSAVAVPEPATAFLAAPGLLGWLTRRRRGNVGSS